MSQPSIFDVVTTAGQGEVLEFDWGRIVWQASRSLGNSTTMTFGLVTIKAGLENPRHRHPNCDEILHVLSGQIEHSLGDERFVLNAGETISIPTGAWHNARALGHENAQMVICFSSADRETEGEGL
jgi:quercetin dioxygenase-like cupin family protein